MCPGNGLSPYLVGYRPEKVLRISSSHPFRSARAREEYHTLYDERARAWPIPSETRLLETPSGQTFVRVSGRPTDPPLILLPGSRATSLTWIPNIAAWSARFRTYALDSIYDFGLSVRRRSLRKPEDLMAWLDEVLGVLVPGGPVRLAGLSYGGWLASLYALRFPERVGKLVLLAPAATVLPVSFALIWRALLTLIPLIGFRRHFYYWLLHDALKSGETGRASVDDAIADWATAERCFSPLPLIGATVLDDQAWQRMKVPCLFVIGEHEKMYPAQKAIRRLNRIAPWIQTRLVPGAGHDLTFVQADFVTRAVLDFLNECPVSNSNAADKTQ